MKKTLKMLLVMGFLAIMMPFTSNAATSTYAIPDGAVGVSEATYKQLKNAKYTDIEHYDQILYQYQNKIIFRADHFGEMYRVPYVGEKPYNPTRYLPDGVYKTSKDYYLLADGKRLKLKDDDYYNTIYSHVINGELKYYGLGTAEKTLMFSGTTEGNAIQEKLRGKIVMLVDGDGSLYYVGTDKNGVDIIFYPLHGQEAIEGFMQSQAITVKFSLMKQIPKHDQYQDIVYENSTYGFSLIFPETWKDYTVKNETFEGVKGSIKAIAFGFKAQDALFDISMYSKIQWVELQSETGPKGTYLAENNRYVFAYSTAQDVANNNMADRMAEVKDIVKTFYLNETEPLSYLTNGTLFTVSKTSASFDLTAEQLKSAAEECGSVHETGYFNQLVSTFSSETTMAKYTFKYTGKSQQPDTYTVTLLPNHVGYRSMDEFKKDFDICSAGGSLYPIMLNNHWLVFESSCGSGYDDGSGKPVGCQEVRDAVASTLKLN